MIPKQQIRRGWLVTLLCSWMVPAAASADLSELALESVASGLDNPVAAGLTDVETSLVVVDTETGVIRRYDKPLGSAFDPIQDTTAFDTCP